MPTLCAFSCNISLVRTHFTHLVLHSNSVVAVIADGLAAHRVVGNHEPQHTGGPVDRGGQHLLAAGETVILLTVPIGTPTNLGERGAAE